MAIADDSVGRGWAVQNPPPIVADYGETTSSFSWQDARAELLERPLPSGFNLGALAVDRHAEGDRALETALHWKGLGDVERKLDYRELRTETNRFANVLKDLGVSAGETVFTMLGRRPALYVAALGTLKHRNVFCPIFSAFGPEPACQRLTLGRGRVLVTTAKIYDRVVAEARKDLPDLEHVLLLDSDQDVPGTYSYEELIGAASDDFDVPETDPEDPAILHFTSGTTGKPKGVVHVHDAAVAHFATSRFALDLRPGDVVWRTADPGGGTGT
jgi:acetyl-CoA synthetase